MAAVALSTFILLFATLMTISHNPPQCCFSHFHFQGCLVEDESSDGASSGLSGARVTFLYKFAAGACPKSYGLNVARLARLPESILLRAAEKSAEFERAVEEAERGLVLP